MLLDGKHKPWLWATAAVAAAAAAGWLAAPAEARRAGGVVGAWYGVGCAALVLAAAALSVVRRLPPWRGGSRPAWLRAHLWLGSLAGVFLLCHCGGHARGPLEQLLCLAALGVGLSGGLVVLLQQVLPHRLAARVGREAPPGRLSGACRALRRRGDALADRAWGPGPPADPGPPARQDVRRQLRAFYEQEVRPFLLDRPPRGARLADPLEAPRAFDRLRQLPALAAHAEVLEELAALCAQRWQLAEQQRLQFWLHAGLWVHVPLSAALLVLAAAHVAASVYF
jgi:hypothetical protein